MNAIPHAVLLFGMLSAQAIGQAQDAMSFTLRNWRSGGVDETLVSAEGVLIVQPRGGILFRSLDTGKSWRPFPVPGGPATGFSSKGPAFDSESGLLYGFSASGIYTASPRAEGWTRINDKLPEYCSIEGSTSILSDEFGVDVSRDGGKTWKITAPERFPDRVAVLAAGSCAYVGNYEGPVSVTCDGGNTWKSPQRDTLSNSASGMVSFQGAIIALTGHGLVRSLDSGKTWVRWFGNLRDDDKLRYLSRTETSLIAARWDTSGFSRSVDGGKTWETHPSPDPQGFRGNSAPVAAIGGKLVWMSVQGVLASGDGGNSWNDVGQRKIHGDIQTLAVQDRAFLALTEQGIFASGDSGITWDLSLPARQEAPWTALIASGGMAAVGGPDGMVRLSADAGGHWSRPLPLPSSDPVEGLAVFGGSAVAASARGLWRLSVPDSGWKTLPLPVADPIRVMGCGPHVLLVATDSHLWRFRPDGSNDDLGAGIPIGKITGLWIIDDRAFAYTSDGYLRQWDSRGAAWGALKQFDRHVLSLAGSQNHLAAATYLGTYVSADAGATWNGTEINWNGGGFFFPVGNVKSLAYNEGFLYAGDDKGGIWQSSHLGSSVVSNHPSAFGTPKFFRNRSILGILRGYGRRADGRRSPGSIPALPPTQALP